MIGICKLCLREKELIGRSHILPNFMYSGMRDDSGRMYVISSTNPRRPRIVQSGAYERHIFCSDCDNNILGSLERYASNALYRKNYLEESDEFHQVKAGPDAEYIYCTSLDYLNFKLFLLSLLWRVSISEESAFENVKLTPEAEEFLRRSIHDHRFMPPLMYPCALTVNAGPEAQADKDFVVVENVSEGIVRLYINQFIYTFCVTPQAIDEAAAHCTIQPNNEMIILKVPIVQWERIRLSILEAMVRASRPHLGSEDEHQ